MKMSSHDRNDTFKYVDFSIHHLDIWISDHLFIFLQCNFAKTDGH